MISSTPQKIGNLEIKNRFIRSATFESLASDGYVNDKLINFYKTLAEGGVGLIITGATAVNGNIRLAEAQMGVFNDDLIPGLKKLADVAHTYGNGCKSGSRKGTHCVVLEKKERIARRKAK